MAEFYSDIATTYNTSKGLHDRALSGQLTSGKVNRCVAVITLTGAMTSGDTIKIRRIDPSMTIQPDSLKISAQDSAFTAMALGYGFEYDDTALTDDTDAFSANTNALTAGRKVAVGEAAAVTDTGLAPFTPEGAGWLTLVLGTTTSPVAGKLLYVEFEFLTAS